MCMAIYYLNGEVDGIPIGNGKVGPKTRKVMETFQAYALSGKGLK